MSDLKVPGFKASLAPQSLATRRLTWRSQASDLLANISSSFSTLSDAQKQAQMKKVRLISWWSTVS